jgi:hypothetical protein
MSDVIERAEAALEGVADSPLWEFDSHGFHPGDDEDDNDTWWDVDGHLGGWVAHCQDAATAEFIAAARQLVPELLAELKRLDQENAQLHSRIEEMQWNHKDDTIPRSEG